MVLFRGILPFSHHFLKNSCHSRCDDYATTVFQLKTGLPEANSIIHHHTISWNTISSNIFSIFLSCFVWHVHILSSPGWLYVNTPTCSVGVLHSFRSGTTKLDKWDSDEFGLKQKRYGWAAKGPLRKDPLRGLCRLNQSRQWDAVLSGRDLK